MTMRIVTVLYILRETSLPSIPTFSQNLDNVVGNDGIQLGSIKEILGLPGTGKTQICLQLCASVQVPEELGGLNSEALYIDTNTNCTWTRFKEILDGSLTRCQGLLKSKQVINEDQAIRRLHHVNAFGIEKFCAFLHNIPNFLISRPNVRLIVIDSITFPFKDDINIKLRTGLLYRLMADLHRVAHEGQIAVVLTNEMSTRVGLSSGAVVGALGDAWAHRCNKRLLLSTPEPMKNLRHAVLMKSNNSPERVGQFLITEEGIRDANKT
ncbi:DNA repair protein RAD51 homolog 3-like isoform X2 [Aricia agestis]|uniref:DNA repair protein RAD51 homolog 3-like isoform X2 n=1 Tax=Aricia agestis TaxID=91739 RepID=UPI001C2028D6|nr:DNA repair protein RAD51 homolog 3-like isoform X2 [Aricia agestis]